MKIKAVLKGNQINFSQVVILKKTEIEVEVDLPDDQVEMYAKEDLENMSLDELTHLIWSGTRLSDEQLAHINKDYKELVAESISERYK